MSIRSIREDKAVLNALYQTIAVVNVHVLRGKAEATKPAVIKAIATANVLHYCGHAFLDGPEPGWILRAARN